MGWFAEPILLTGDYPDIMKQQIANKSRVQGVHNRLPEFKDTEKAQIKGKILTHSHYCFRYLPLVHVHAGFSPKSQIYTQQPKKHENL